jgi:hypothetical protein
LNVFGSRVEVEIQQIFLVVVSMVVVLVMLAVIAFVLVDVVLFWEKLLDLRDILNVICGS